MKVTNGNFIEKRRKTTIFTAYSSYAMIMYVLAPILTFGFVLSLFKNISAYKNYLFSYRKDVYAFSEINKKSVALGKSIAEKYPKAAIVYASAAEDVAVNDFPEGTKIIN